MEKKMDFKLAENSDRKLTSWKKEPTIQQLKTDLEAAKPAQQAQMSRIDRWNDLMSVSGKAKPKVVPGRSSVQPKLIRRQAEWRYSALTEPFLGSNKLFKVTPVTFEDDEGAKQNELVLNWQMRTKLNRVSFIDNYVRSTVDEGTSITRIGWKRVTVPVKEEVPVYEHYQIEDEQQLQLLQQAIELKQSNQRDYDETVDPAIKAAVDMYEEQQIPTYAVQVGTEIRTVDKILENRPLIEVMNPKNVFIDPSCGDDFDKALFVVVSFETNKADLLKEGKRYKNLDKIDWESNSPLMQPDHETRTPQDFQFKDASRKKVVAYEYWGFYDVEGNGKLVPFVATWIGDVLIRMEENPFPDEKLPFVVVPYLPIKRSLYGEPDAELLEDNQKILGAITRGMIDLLGRSANSMQGMPKGMLDVVNKRRFENGQDYEYNPNSNPNNGLIEHKYPELPQSALMMLNIQNQEAEALTGVKSFGGGMSGEAYGDVAAGIRGVLDAASKREMAILRRLAKGMTQIGQKLISMNAEFLSEEETIRVTNRDFVTIKREDLKGNFDLETDISTVEVDNAKAQDLGFMLQTIGPNTDPSIVMMILAEIAELKRMPALAEKLRTFRPQPTPEQQKMSELEILKAQKEVEKLDSEIQLNLAKAEREKAEKDMANLNFVEQESGTNHAREMEKQAGQAKGNMDLEVSKALLKPRKLANGSETKPNIEAAVGFKSIADKIDNPDSNSMMTSPITRDIAAESDPRLNLNSQEYDPRQDPAMNPNLTI